MAWRGGLVSGWVWLVVGRGVTGLVLLRGLKLLRFGRCGACEVSLLAVMVFMVM